jgi:uncharacterized membrane-anchored protein YjiN (DUF445 family)
VFQRRKLLRRLQEVDLSPDEAWALLDRVLTVREHLDALDTATLIAQIEARVGTDLQVIRLNGALVGGLVGLLLALVHRVLG